MNNKRVKRASSPGIYTFINYGHLEQDNEKTLKFRISDSFYFEIGSSLF